MEILADSLVEGSDKDFAAAVHVLISKPNSVNKRLVGADILEIKSLSSSILKIDDVSTISIEQWIKSYVTEEVKKLHTNVPSQAKGVDLSKGKSLLPNLFHEVECQITRTCLKKQQYTDINNPKSNKITDDKNESILWKQCTINNSQNILLVIFAPFNEVLTVAFVYQSEKLSSGSDTTQTKVDVDPQLQRRITILTESKGLKPSPKYTKWLREKCFKQVVKWCNAKIGSGTQSENSTASMNLPSNPSLRLVSLKEYDRLYNELKIKYVKKLVDSNAWSTESTDPEKFIHEDIGIAVYLILIWKSSGTSAPISFADIGCGNGLLVYILVSEGIGKGVGFDLRERKIWNTLKNLGSGANQKIDLRVSTISPNETNLGQFSDFDWLIGNHSDELTPWLPLMARKSKAKLFLLPCCPFEFYGKYRRRGASNIKSTYREYLDYICEVGEGCGFIMEEDRLKIPSTRRICFVARCDKLTSIDNEMVETLSNSNNIGINTEIIDNNINLMLATSKNNCGISNFSARANVEEVKNCTKISKLDVIQPIVDIVVKTLLSMEDWTIEAKPLIVVPSAEKKRKLDFHNTLPERNANDETYHTNREPNLDHPDIAWNAGGLISLSELSSKIDSALLVKLKSECGGLQTLLRNHNYIFVVEKGNVRLRCPLYDAHSVGKRKKGRGRGELEKFKKTKICWLFENHPQGCPILREDCIWAHGVQDLRA